MFALSPELPVFSEAGLQSLHLSLNRAVLDRADLPVGPARAAILVFAEEYGGLGVAVGLRCAGGRRVAVFRYQGDVDRPLELDEAVQTGLSFAKDMGFLFDERNPMVPGGATGRADALRRWHALLEESGAVERAGPSTLPARSPSSQVEELLLEDSLGEAPQAPTPGAPTPRARTPRPQPAAGKAATGSPVRAAPARADASASASVDAGRATASAPPRPKATVPPELSLTKFREDEAKQASLSNSGSGSELGRIPLVRKRAASGRDGLLARLLGSF